MGAPFNTAAVPPTTTSSTFSCARTRKISAGSIRQPFRACKHALGTLEAPEAFGRREPKHPADQRPIDSVTIDCLLKRALDLALGFIELTFSPHAAKLAAGFASDNQARAI
jgi:hypothetical protein